MNLRPVVRITAPVAVAASLMVTLAACGSSSKPDSASSASSSPSASGAATAGTCAQSGPESDAVSVTGDYGKTPAIAIKGALKATGLQRTVATKGTGDAESAGVAVQAHITMFDATGKKLSEQEAYLPLDPAITTPGIVSALSCVPYGSRTVTTGRGSDYFGQTAPTGLTLTDTYVVVADIEKAFVPTAWTTQLPTVTFDASGTPTLKLQGQPLPDWSIKVLQEGTGAVVKATDNVTLNYQGTSWDTGKMFDQSFGKQPTTFSATQVVPGFGYAIVGQKVGTKFVVTIPPALGYGTDANNPNARGLGGQTLVFVIDIISAAAGN